MSLSGVAAQYLIQPIDEISPPDGKPHRFFRPLFKLKARIFKAIHEVQSEIDQRAHFIESLDEGFFEETRQSLNLDQASSLHRLELLRSIQEYISIFEADHGDRPMSHLSLRAELAKISRLDNCP